MGEASLKQKLAEEEIRQIDQRVSAAIAQSRKMAVPEAHLKQMDQVLRPYCQLLAEYRREGRDIEEVFLAWMHTTQNMMAELMLCTSTDTTERTQQALHMANLFLQSLPGVMKWAETKTLLSGAAKQGEKLQ
jgi:hypothetical protein